MKAHAQEVPCEMKTASDGKTAAGQCRVEQGQQNVLA